MGDNWKKFLYLQHGNGGGTSITMPQAEISL
jgi:hypothetical protein